eukprot:3591017-Prorocentrum_lima.AAC.1
MTSSLVGSEMCIRDRPPACSQVQPSDGLPLPDNRLPVVADWPVLMLLPVSYTHLTLPTICSV